MPVGGWGADARFLQFVLTRSPVALNPLTSCGVGWYKGPLRDPGAHLGESFILHYIFLLSSLQSFDAR